MATWKIVSIAGSISLLLSLLFLGLLFFLWRHRPVAHAAADGLFETEGANC